MWPLRLLQPRSETHARAESGEDIPLRQLQATEALAPGLVNHRRFQTPRRSAEAYLQADPQLRLPERQIAHARLRMDPAKDDLLLTLARRSAHVTQQLQTLLDAQSDGLMRGLGRDPAAYTASQSASRLYLSPNGHGDTVPQGIRDSVYRDDPLRSPSDSLARPGSSVTASQSTYTSHPGRQKVIPVRQPLPPKPLSLREARAGIAENLRALAAVKTEEAGIYSGRAESGSEGLAHIQNLTEQEHGLKAELARHETGPAEDEEQLQRQEIELDGEIRTLEERLSELRAQLRDVRKTRSEKENIRAAEASSYRNSLDELSRRVRRDILSNRSQYRRPKAKTGRDKSVWGLPEDRRTLDLVKEDIQSQISEAEGCRKAAVLDGIVCEEGARVWDGVKERMENLEKRLSQEIKKLNSGRPNSSLSNGASDEPIKTPADSVHPSEPPGEGMHGVMELMDHTINVLQTDLDNVEEKGWTLLVCCIGAELEALKEAQELLSDTLVRSQMLPSTVSNQPADGPSGPKSEGSGLTTSMYTAKESAGSHTPGAHDEALIGDEEDEQDVSDPQALFSGT